MSICDDARTEGIAKVIAAYGPTIAELLKVIKNMKEKGLDPQKFYNPAANEVVNLPEFVADLSAQQEAGKDMVNKKVNEECEESLAFMQSVVDAAVATFTLGLSEVLPKHMTHIDIGEILAGKPLGGDNSIFNQVRDSIFNGLGMGENNDFRRWSENPIGTAKTDINNIFEDLGIPIRL